MRITAYCLLAGFLAALSGCSSHTGVSTNHYNRGIQLSPSDPKQAEKEFKAALKENPNNEFAYNQLGKLYFTQKRLPEAVDCFKNAVRVGPNNVDFVGNLASAAYLVKDYALAAENFKRAAELVPNAPAYPYSLGVIAEKEGRKAEAANYYRQALRLDPAYTRARVRLYAVDPNGPQP